MLQCSRYTEFGKAFFFSLLPCKYGLILTRSFLVCKETKSDRAGDLRLSSVRLQVRIFIHYPEKFLFAFSALLFNQLLPQLFRWQTSSLISCRYPHVISQGIKQTNWNTPRFVLLLLRLNHPPLVAAFVGLGGRSPPSTPLQYCCGKLVPWPLGGLAPRHSTLTED